MGENHSFAGPGRSGAEANECRVESLERFHRVNRLYASEGFPINIVGNCDGILSPSCDHWREDTVKCRYGAYLLPLGCWGFTGYGHCTPSSSHDGEHEDSMLNSGWAKNSYARNAIGDVFAERGYS
jgi:hypothetical protein